LRTEAAGSTESYALCLTMIWPSLAEKYFKFYGIDIRVLNYSYIRQRQQYAEYYST